MDATCLAHCLTEEEKSEFEKNGYLVIEDVLSQQHVHDLNTAASPIVAEYRRARGIDNDVMANPFDYIGRNELFLNLLDWPLTFPKVWGILGWHIQLYHTHMMTVPPEPRLENGLKRLGWHQDSGRLDGLQPADARADHHASSLERAIILGRPAGIGHSLVGCSNGVEDEVVHLLEFFGRDDRFEIELAWTLAAGHLARDLGGQVVDIEIGDRADSRFAINEALPHPGHTAPQRRHQAKAGHDYASHGMNRAVRPRAIPGPRWVPALMAANPRVP